MKVIKTFSLLFAALTLLSILAGPQARAQHSLVPDEIEDRGVIHELVVQSNSIVIDGVIYRVTYDARVQIEVP